MDEPLMIDSRVANGMEKQIERMQLDLGCGAKRIGWKIGINAEALQRKLEIPSSVVGYLTDATLLATGGSYAIGEGTRIGVEPEVAIHIGRTLARDTNLEAAASAIAGLGCALEVIDMDRPIENLKDVIATNIFHRAVIFSPCDLGRAGGALGGIAASVSHNGEFVAEIDPAAVYGDLAKVVLLVARLLDSFGLSLQTGDRIIAGAMCTPLWVGPGDEVSLDAGPLGKLSIRMTA